MGGLRGYKRLKPLVSIVTPSYNQGKFIRETIASVLSQDYDNLEYIIIDGGSTDNTLDIIKEYDGRITYITEKDNGQSDAINKGFKMAHGEIVAWLNSDDVYEPHCISRAIEEFEKNPKLGLLYGEGYIIDELSNKVRVFEHTQEFDYWKLVNFWDYIMQPATFFKKEMLQKVGYLDVNLHYCMDWDLWIRLAAVSEVKYIPELLACSREYSETKTNTGGNERLKEIIGLLQKYSGKKKTLGIKSYKASTFYTKHANDTWIIRKLTGAYLTYMHRWLYGKIPEKSVDGWIGKKYSFIVSGGIRQVILSIECVLPQTIPQEISIYINQKKVKKKKICQVSREDIVLEMENKRFINEVTIACRKTVREVDGDKKRKGLKIVDIAYVL